MDQKMTMRTTTEKDFESYPIARHHICSLDAHFPYPDHHGNQLAHESTAFHFDIRRQPDSHCTFAQRRASTHRVPYTSSPILYNEKFASFSRGPHFTPFHL